MTETLTKRCTKCGAEKPLAAFSRARRYRGGRRTWCKACHAACQRRWRRSNLRGAEEIARRSRKRHPGYFRLYARRPERRRRNAVRVASYWAVRMGVLVRRDACEHCGRSAAEVRLDRHHPDYDQPLNVVWLCRPCHVDEHCRLRAEARAAT